MVETATSSRKTLEGQGNDGSDEDCFYYNSDDDDGSSCGGSSDFDDNDNDNDRIAAANDVTHDGLWLALDLNGMMIHLDDDDFLSEQEETYENDLKEGLVQPDKRHEEFVILHNDYIEEILLTLRERGLSMASGLLRRWVCCDEACCPPVVRITRLNEDDMSEFMAHKQRGNEHFKKGKYQEAIEAYEDAQTFLPPFQYFYVASCDQMNEVVNVLSNQAECHLRLYEYSEAGDAATDALVLDGNHVKSRIRRAKAELALHNNIIDEEKRGNGNLTYLVQAMVDLNDVLNNPDCSSCAQETAQEMMEQVENLLEQKRQQEADDTNFDLKIRFLKTKCW